MFGALSAMRRSAQHASTRLTTLRRPISKSVIARAETSADFIIPPKPKDVILYKKGSKGEGICLGVFAATGIIASLLVAPDANAMGRGSRRSTGNNPAASKAPSKSDLEKENSALKAQLEAMKRGNAGEEGDPMDEDLDNLAKDASAADAAAAGARGGSKRSQEGPRHAALRLGAHSLADADHRLLDQEMGDQGLEDIRRATNEQLQAVLPDLPPEYAGPVKSLAIGIMQEAMACDLNRRAASYSNRVSSQAERVKQHTKSCADSPSKIKQHARILHDPSAEVPQAAQDLKALFDQAAAITTSAKATNASVTDLSLELDKLLLAHKRRSKSRATRQDFVLHVHEARATIEKAVKTARYNKDYKLACELTEAIRHHENQLQQFFGVCDRAGFETARDAYLSRANPIGGMTETAWEFAASMAAAGEHRAMFKLLFADKLGLSGKGKKKRRAAGGGVLLQQQQRL